MENDLDRNPVIARIRAALRRRSGKSWSVTGGTGTAWGWISIDAPPARRTWIHAQSPTGWEERDSGAPGGHASPADRAELAQLLGLDAVHHQGVSIPAGSDYRREYIDRAEGQTPSAVGKPYWD